MLINEANNTIAPVLARYANYHSLADAIAGCARGRRYRRQPRGATVVLILSAGKTAFGVYPIGIGLRGLETFRHGRG